MASSTSERLAAVKQSIEALKEKIAALKTAKQEQINWATYGKKSEVAYAFAIRRQLRGHFGKVYAVDWGSDNTSLLSASQDGKLILWNAMSETKKDAITLKSPWVMSCAFEKTEQRFVACGGLDNICTVYDLRNPVVPAYELVGHDGYLSCCAFVGAGGKAMLTSSGDSTCILWDAERAVRKQTFKDHSADVMSVSLHPTDPNVFASGSCDSTVRVWDIRLNSCVRTFTGHISDINSVEFFPSGTVVGSGSDDSSCRLFDLRSCGPINIFTEDKIICGITDVAFSRTGRLMFAGYEENFCVAWETTSKDGAFHELKGHKDRVSCLAVNPTGQALCTGSWDTELAVWA